MNHDSLVHKFIPMPQATKIPDVKASVVKERKTRENFGITLDEVKNQKEGIDEARNKTRKVHVASLMDLCHLENRELELRYQKEQN